MLHKYSRIPMNTNHVFRLVNPVCGMNMYLFKVIVFIKQAKYEQNPVFSCFRSGLPRSKPL